MSRLFLGFSLPDGLQKRLAEEADRLRLAGAPVRWVPPANYHVTLRFLGEVPDAEQGVLFSLMADEAARSRALQLVLKGLGCRPRQGAPRIIWCGVEGRDPADQEVFLALHRDLGRALGHLGFRWEKRRFEPHVTLGRLRQVRLLETTRDLLERLGPGVRREFGHCRVEDLTLFLSTRARGRLIYTPLHRVPLS